LFERIGLAANFVESIRLGKRRNYLSNISIQVMLQNRELIGWQKASDHNEAIPVTMGLKINHADESTSK